MKVCLTVAGLDPSGGAGIVADVKTFAAFGCFAAAAVSSITFQNARGVFGGVAQTADTVRRQILPVVEEYEIAAVKIGMLPTAEIVEAVAGVVRENNLKNLVVDPVIRSTSGFDLIDDAALRALVETLFPLAALVTPNLPEAEKVARMKIETEADIERAARVIQSAGAKNVLIKGGHRPIQYSRFKKRIARDYLFAENEAHIFEAEFIETAAVRGTGCTLSAAIAANLALGKSLFESVERAKEFITETIRTTTNLLEETGRSITR